MSNATVHAITALPRELVQIAYIVPDLEAACLEWAEKVGAGPFLIRANMDIRGTHNGEPAVYRHSAAFGQWGPVMLELVQIHECTPASMHEAFAHSAPNQVNHVAYFVEDLDISSAALQERGCTLITELETTSGMRVQFLDGREITGGLIELYVGTEHLRALYDKVAALHQDWDGTEVIRYL